MSGCTWNDPVVVENKKSGEVAYTFYTEDQDKVRITNALVFLGDQYLRAASGCRLQLNEWASRS